MSFKLPEISDRTYNFLGVIGIVISIGLNLTLLYQNRKIAKSLLAKAEDKVKTTVSNVV